MSSQNVKNWLSDLADKGNKERSRNTKLTAVKEVYKFLKDEFKDQIDEDILRIPFAKVPKREAKCLDFEDAMDLLSYVKDSRVKTGMAIGFGTGVRFCELIQITCTDIENGYADYTVGSFRANIKEGAGSLFPTMTIHSGTYISKSTTGTIKNDSGGNLVVYDSKSKPETNAKGETWFIKALEEPLINSFSKLNNASFLSFIKSFMIFSFQD